MDFILRYYRILISGSKGFIRITLRMDPSVAEIRDRCVENIGRRVYTGLAGILDYTDDETNAYNLHGDIVWDSKQLHASGIRRREPPATPEAPGRAGRRQYTHDPGASDRNVDIQCICRR